VTYEVTVKTTNKRGAGTDANVYIIIYGELGDSGERHLNKSKTHRNKFERNQTDIFDLEIVHLGELKKVRVWHDNSGLLAKWHLETITVKDTKTGKEYEFPCNRWLAKGEDDGSVSRELGLKVSLGLGTTYSAVHWASSITVEALPL
jgi:hypothetical protein